MKKQEELVFKCPHFAQLKTNYQNHDLQSNLVKTSWKGWDGCIRRQATIKEMSSYLTGIYVLTLDFDTNHKVFIHNSTLEIRCFDCDVQIFDEETNAKQVRSMAIQIDKQKQKFIYGSNIEYSPAFQKQKEGIAGTVGCQLNSYVNSAVQLLSHLSPFYKMVSQIVLEDVQNKLMKYTFEAICKIRSGTYRIVETKNIQAQIMNQNKLFCSYAHKTPTNFFYEFLKYLSLEFQYEGTFCASKQVLGSVDLDVENPPIGVKTHYGPLKQLFSGQFICGVQCVRCQGQKTLKTSFECIRLEQDSQSHIEHPHIPKMQKLIETAFNFEKSLFAEFVKLKCESIKCHGKEARFKIRSQKSRVKTPNILLLQFTARSQGMNVSLPDNLNLSKYSKIENQQLIYEYVGSIGKVNKKYFTHVRQMKNLLLKEYTFDDAFIKQDSTVKPERVKCAVYKIQALQKNKNLSKNIESSIIVDVDCFIPLPDFWNFYVSDLRFVQTLINPFLCRHGLLKTQIHSKSRIVRKIPPSVYSYLVEQFGGVMPKIQKENDYCQTCLDRLNMIRSLKQSERQMAKLADQFSNKKSKAHVDLEWFKKWKKYLYDKVDMPYQNQLIKRPGPINNKRGLTQDGNMNEQMYKKVSLQVWYFFKKVYGGAPLISKSTNDPSIAFTQTLDMQYENIKNLIYHLYPENK